MSRVSPTARRVPPGAVLLTQPSPAAQHRGGAAVVHGGGRTKRGSGAPYSRKSPRTCLLKELSNEQALEGNRPVSFLCFHPSPGRVCHADTKGSDTKS